MSWFVQLTNVYFATQSKQNLCYLRVIELMACELS